MGEQRYASPPAHYKNMKKQRTLKQNKAYWKYLTEVAFFLREHGISLRKVMANYECYATKDNLHDIFKVVVEMKYGKDSTRKLTTKEFSDCVDEFEENMHKAGVITEFPSRDKEELLKQYTQEYGW